MNLPTAQTEEAAHTRRLIALSVLLLTSAVIVIVGYNFRRTQPAAPASSPPRGASPEATVAWVKRQNLDPNNLPPAVKKAYRDAFRARAKTLRADWQTWALAHPDLLQAMQNTPASDLAKVVSLRNAIIDSRHGPKGTRGVDVGSLAESITPFSWQLEDARRVRYSSNLISKVEWDKQATRGEIELQKTFAQCRDFVVSYSMSPGMWKVALWASGRITETEDMAVRRQGHATQIVEGQHHEIVTRFQL